MKLNFKYLLLLIPSALAIDSNAQTGSNADQKRIADSTLNLYRREAAFRTPTLRQVVISTDLISSSKVKSELLGTPLLEGKLKQIRMNALVNLPLKRWGKNSLSSSFSMSRQHFELTDIKALQPQTSTANSKTDKLAVGFSINYTRLDSLFGTQVVYMASMSGLTGRGDAIQRLNWLGGVMFTLTQQADRSSSIGFLINIDPSINVPFVPVYTYWRKYQNNIELNINLPEQVSLRKPLGNTMAATLGTSFSGSYSFFKFDQPGIPNYANFSSLELKTGLGIEKRFGKIVMFGLNAGILSPIQSRMFGTSEQSKKYFVKNDLKSSSYLNFTLSLLPFIK
ncbi:MAG: hypothetical protein LBF27_01175 [Sphingobacterium sp.]|jgi:hypothetical protein|nr:hypothetical protein [Sphingobacterium sp.]